MKKIFLLLFLNSVFFFAYSAEKKIFPFSSEQIEVSSFLKEGKNEYSEKCLSPEVDRPWVPEGGNNGKNQTITIKDCCAMDIYISIGYVSKDRPDLYAKNSRPKKVKVQFSETGKTKEFLLKDTKEPQQLQLIDSEEDFFSHPKNTIVLSFPEVYEGTKYKDLCVNFIGVQNIFSGIKFNFPYDEDITYNFKFGADTVIYDGNFYALDYVKKIEFKYAHNKKLNRLYLLFDKVQIKNHDKLLNENEYADFINSKDFINQVKSFYFYRNFTQEQWNEFQKSSEVMMRSLFENPMTFQIDYGNNYGDLILNPVIKYSDERLFAALTFGSSIIIRSCDDTIKSSGFYSNSCNVPEKNNDENWVANYSLMKKNNNTPDKNGWYSFVTGFLNPVVIKYKKTEVVSEELKYNYTFDFIYPDGSRQNGYLKAAEINLSTADGYTLNSDYIPDNFTFK